MSSSNWTRFKTQTLPSLLWRIFRFKISKVNPDDNLRQTHKLLYIVFCQLCKPIELRIHCVPWPIPSDLPSFPSENLASWNLKSSNFWKHPKKSSPSFLTETQTYQSCYQIYNQMYVFISSGMTRPMTRSW